MIQPRSLRFRLTAWLFGALAYSLLVFIVSTEWVLRDSLAGALDQNLKDNVADVGDFILKASSGGKSESQWVAVLAEQVRLGLSRTLLEVRTQDGRILCASPSVRPHPLWKGRVANPEISYTTDGQGESAIRVAYQTFATSGGIYGVTVASPLQRSARVMARFNLTLCIAAPLLLLLAAFVGYWMSGRALAPIAGITTDAGSISPHDLNARLKVPVRKDELHRLVVTLNSMLDRIELAMSRMVQFTGDASHELRAPLTLIHTAAEFSLRRQRDPSELVEALRKILRESQRTSILVDDLLMLARNDSPAEEALLEPLDLALIARSAAERAKVLTREKKIEPRTDIPSQRVVVAGEESALTRLFIILLDNALKYTNAGGSIDLGLWSDAQRVVLTVADSGIGIVTSDIPHIFDRFWRADKVRSRGVGGAGLGLAIAKCIVEQHGGAIAVDSKVGRGTRFTISFKLLSTGAQPAPAAAMSTL